MNEHASGGFKYETRSYWETTFVTFGRQAEKLSRALAVPSSSREAALNKVYNLWFLAPPVACNYVYKTLSIYKQQ